MLVSRSLVYFILATIPLLFASVHPWVWSVYVVCIFTAFSALLWQKQLIWKQSWLLTFTVGIFFLITILQIVPLPIKILSFLNPFKIGVQVQSKAIINTPLFQNTSSYYPLNSLAWWIFLLSLFLYFIVFRKSFNSYRKLKPVLFVLLIAASVEALYGIMQALVPTLGVLWVDYIEAYMGNARGTYINRNHFAGFMEMLLPLGLGYTLSLGNWDEKISLKALMSYDRPNFQFFLAIGLSVMTLALLFSKSRAGIFGGILGFLSFILFMRIGIKKLPLSFWIITLAIIGLVSSYSLRIGVDPILERFLKISQDTSRLDIWRDSVSIIKDHPFGTGLGSFKQVYPVYNVSTISEKTAYYAHNDYLQLLVEAGWIGFVALVGGFYIFLVRSFRRISNVSPQADPLRFFLGIGALSGLVSIAFHSFFDFNLQMPANCIYFVTLIAIVHICLWKDRQPLIVQNHSGKFWYR